ncbi:MAG: hypothetical protein MJ014_06445 [Methanocorpusculum sp.]|nr:hypothetical protein [Methanocorpusculum sp.]
METVIPEGNGNYTMWVVTMTLVAGKISATDSGTAKIRLNATETRSIYENVTAVTLDSWTMNDLSSQAPLTLSTLSIEVSVE